MSAGPERGLEGPLGPATAWGPPPPALHWAGTHGMLGPAKALVKLGADTGLLDVEGKPPVHWAAARNIDDSARLVTLLVGFKLCSEAKTVCDKLAGPRGPAAPSLRHH